MTLSETTYTLFKYSVGVSDRGLSDRTVTNWFFKICGGALPSHCRDARKQMLLPLRGYLMTVICEGITAFWRLGEIQTEQKYAFFLKPPLARVRL